MKKTDRGYLIALALTALQFALAFWVLLGYLDNETEFTVVSLMTVLLVLAMGMWSAFNAGQIKTHRSHGAVMEKIISDYQELTGRIRESRPWYLPDTSETDALIERYEREWED